MTTVELLKAARKRIEDPARWLSGERVYAQDCNGNTVDPKDQSAACWCADGALESFVDEGSDEHNAARNFTYKASISLGFPGPISLNDSTDHATVLHMYDLAIAAAEATA